MRTLFACDSDGRLLYRNEPGGAAAPHFFFGRTRDGTLWRFSAALSHAALRDLARLAGKEPGLPANGAAPGPLRMPPPPDRMESMRRVLEEWGTSPITIGRSAAFRFPASPPDSRARAARGRGKRPAQRADGTAGWDPKQVREIRGDRSERADCFGPHFPWLIDEMEGRKPVVAALDRHGVALSVCHAARGGRDLARGEPGARGAVEAGLETAEGHRSRGLAVHVVREWAIRVRELGGTPLYSTSWDNRASLAVARRLSLVYYGEGFHFG